MNVKLRYLVASTVRGMARQNLECPSCGCSRSETVARKYLVTSLRRCRDCHLLFRAPTTPAAEYDRYYQAQYRSGLTTTLPDDAQLQGYKANGFSDTEKDFSRYIEIVEALGVSPGARILDYGCSWGYGCWQFEQHGYSVQGYDLSEIRAAYGREKLGVDLVWDTAQIAGPFDVFFSTHVVEHVPNAESLLNFAFSKLNPGGVYIAVTPNGSQQYRAKKPGNWSRVWGFKHPILFDEIFLQHSFAGYQYLATTRLNDYSGMSRWASSTDSLVDDMSGWELLVAARPHSIRSSAA